MIADIGPIPLWRDGAGELLGGVVRRGTPLGILLGGLIGALVDWLFRLSGFAVAAGLIAGGLLGHLVSPPGSRSARAGADGGGGDNGGGFFDFGSNSGSDNCDSSGSDSGSCDGGGGDGGGD
jgi:hypothetical protein